MKDEKRMLYALLIGLIIAILGILIVSAVAGYGPMAGVVHPTYAWEEWGIPMADAPPCGNIGDVNNDGLVTTTDAGLVAEYILSGWSPVDPKTPLSEDIFSYRADVNGDDVVTSADVSLIGSYVAGTIDTFPVCGTMDGYIISSDKRTGPFTPGGTADLGWIKVGNNPTSATGDGIMHMKLMQNMSGILEEITTYSHYLIVGGDWTFTMPGIAVPNDPGASWKLAVYVYGEDELRWDVNRDGVCDQADVDLVSAKKDIWTGVPGAIPEDVDEDGDVDLYDVRLTGKHYGENYRVGAGSAGWTAYISGVESPWAWILAIVFGVASVGIPAVYYNKDKWF